MESLSETIWDVVIAGTDLPQSLLALSLSRSDKKILHVDRNEYYGGLDAALSLREASEWAKSVNDSDLRARFKDVRISVPRDEPNGPSSNILEQSRKYTLSLSPQLIYAQSKLLPALVSSRVHTQLEFQAIGSWWVHKDKKLHRIPSGREDVFADDSLSRRDKIALMKFLRFVVKEQGPQDPAEAIRQTQEDVRSFASLLVSDFKVSSPLHQPLLALSLSPLSCPSTKSNYALPRIKRHMTSIGAFGPGFGAVIPKFGGNAEIAQVGCRAGAVGGGVYVLGADIRAYEPANVADHIRVLLSNGEQVITKHVVGSIEALSNIAWSEKDKADPSPNMVLTTHYVGIISAPLSQLFPQTSENGPVPAGAVILVDDATNDGDASPIYLQVHSEDTGECPSGQCVIYGSVLMTEHDDEEGSRERLRQAVEEVILSCDIKASVLWEMSYTSRSLSIDGAPLRAHFKSDPSGRILALPPQHEDIAFDDGVLETVKAVWERIMGSAADGVEFMRFEERSGEEVDE